MARVSAGARVGLSARSGSRPEPRRGLRLGLDTGGTCTDAALLDAASRVVGSAKAPTTHGRLIDGLGRAARAALAAAGADGADVGLVSLSTTLATNALVEGRGRPAGLVLVGARPSALAGAELVDALGSDPASIVAGGHDAAGEPLGPLDRDALERFARAHAAAVEAWAVSAVFAVRNPAHELEAAELLRAATNRPVTCGHELASALDAPRRAVTALLNARLAPGIAALVDAAHALLEGLGIAAPLMVVRGDGSLVAASIARARPVETILSGPAASVVGACALARTGDALVVDTGGTTSDVARVEGGLPRLSASGATVGGYRTMVRAIEIRSVGLGGDSEVRPASPTRGGGSGSPRPGRAAGGSRSIAGRVVLGPARTVPLSSLAGPERPAAERAAVLAALAEQLARGRPAGADGRFVVRLPVPSGGSAGDGSGDGSGDGTGRLPPALAGLLARLGPGPAAVETLARETGLGAGLERPLARLEARGLVLRAGFTPTDAALVVDAADAGAGDADANDADANDAGADDAGADADALAAARAGAALLARALGAIDVRGIAADVLREASLRVALACADAGLGPVGPDASGGPDGSDGPARRARLDWLAELLRERDPGPGSGLERALVLSARLGVPIVGVGGPAARLHPAAAALLGTRCVLPEHGAVANAVGAVAGVVREVRRVALVADGSHAFRVLTDAGPVRVAGAETAWRLAAEAAERAARAAALAAGARDVTVSLERRDVAASRDGARVLLESVAVATAVGRPVEARTPDVPPGL